MLFIKINLILLLWCELWVMRHV